MRDVLIKESHKVEHNIVEGLLYARDFLATGLYVLGHLEKERFEFLSALLRKVSFFDPLILAFFSVSHVTGSGLCDHLNIQNCRVKN